MKQDWKQLYGEVPERFEHKVLSAVADAPEAKGVRIPKMAVALTAALVLLCSTAYAVASHLGLLDAMSGMRYLHMRDGAQSMLAPGVEVTMTGENPYVEITLLEALSDGYKIWMQLQVAPKDGTIIMPSVGRPWKTAPYASRKEPDAAEETYAELAAERGAPLVMLNITSQMTENQFLEDGSVIITMAMDYAQVATLPVKTWVVPPEQYTEDAFAWPFDQFGHEVSVALSVPVTNEETVYAAEMDLLLEELQITIQRVSFIQTPIGCYLRLEYKPELAFLNRGVNRTFRLYYETMVDVMQPVITVDGVANDYCHPVRRENGQYEWINAYFAMDEIPMDFELSLHSFVYLVPVNGDTRQATLSQSDTYATFSVHLEPAQ